MELRPEPERIPTKVAPEEGITSAGVLPTEKPSPPTSGAFNIPISETLEEISKPFGEINIEKIPPDLKIKVIAVREKTGKKVSLNQNAREAIKEHQSKLEKFRQFMECVMS